MTTTYVPADLPTSNLYQVRFYLGDTDPSYYELQDEEINWAITIRGNNWGATSMCADALAAKYARLTSISADGVSQNLGQRIQNFRIIAAEYQKKEAIYCSTPWLGGAYKAQMYAALADSGRVPEIFRLGLSDDPPSNGVDPVNSPGLGTGGPGPVF